MRPIFTTACVIFGLALAQTAAGEPSVKDLAARAEIRAIETLNVSDQQFLTGDKNGKPVTIAGELRLPRSASTASRAAGSPAFRPTRPCSAAST
jgi:hypothetical protein